MGLLSNAATLIKQGNDSFLGSVLKSGGLTMMSATIIYTVVSAYANAIKTSFTGVPVVVLQLAGLAGVDTAFSILLGAILTSSFLKSRKAGVGFKQ